MPPHIKAVLTGAIIVVAVLAWLFRDVIGLDASPLLLFGLTGFMVLALWLFPEVKKDKPGR
jgi:hypothetical protein